MLSRRAFVGVSGLVVLASRAARAEGRVPDMLDHILLGCRNLDEGIALVERQTGVRAAIGGVHPGIGTRNALLSLGVRHYLEIIAPDPAQADVPASAAGRLTQLQSLQAPRLIEWAAHVTDIETLATSLRAQGVAIEGPRPGSRQRPDGRLLQWKTLGLADDRHGGLPFFIEWSAGSAHPSVDAPQGCRLEDFAAVDPDPAALSSLIRRLGLDLVVRSGAPGLVARIVGRTGTMELH